MRVSSHVYWNFIRISTSVLVRYTANVHNLMTIITCCLCTLKVMVVGFHTWHRCPLRDVSTLHIFSLFHIVAFILWSLLECFRHDCAYDKIHMQWQALCAYFHVVHLPAYCNTVSLAPRVHYTTQHGICSLHHAIFHAVFRLLEAALEGSTTPLPYCPTCTSVLFASIQTFHTQSHNSGMNNNLSLIQTFCTQYHKSGMNNWFPSWCDVRCANASASCGIEISMFFSSWVHAFFFSAVPDTLADTSSYTSTHTRSHPFSNTITYVRADTCAYAVANHQPHPREYCILFCCHVFKRAGRRSRLWTHVWGQMRCSTQCFWCKAAGHRQNSAWHGIRNGRS